MRNRQRNSVWRGGGEPHLPRETPQGPAPPPTTALQSGGAPRELRSTSGEPPRVLRAPRPERGGSADPTHPGALAAHRDAQLGLDWTGRAGPNQKKNTPTAPSNRSSARTALSRVLFGLTPSPQEIPPRAGLIGKNRRDVRAGQGQAGCHSL